MGQEKFDESSPEKMVVAQKQAIALKFLSIKAPGTWWENGRDKPEMKKRLTAIATDADLPIGEVNSFFDQLVGKQEVILNKEKQLEIALLIMQTSLRLMIEEEGIIGLSNDAERVAEEIGVPISEYRKFLKEIFQEYLNVLFPDY